MTDIHHIDLDYCHEIHFELITHLTIEAIYERSLAKMKIVIRYSSVVVYILQIKYGTVGQQETYKLQF